MNDNKRQQQQQQTITNDNNNDSFTIYVIPDNFSYPAHKRKR